MTTFVTIKSCDPSDGEARVRMADEVAKILEKTPNAKVTWLQSSAATSSFGLHRLTAIITILPAAYRGGAAP